MNFQMRFDESEAANESGASERCVQTCPIKAQSTAVARAAASICNAERARLGVTGGHGGFVHSFLSSLAIGSRLYFPARHPAVDVKLHVDNWPSLLHRLSAEELDFFISDIREIPASDDITIEPLGMLKGSLFCRAGHPLSALGSLELADLATTEFASVYMPDMVRNALLELMAEHTRASFPVVFECESAVVTRELIFRTDMVLVACREAVQVELDCGLLEELCVRQFTEMGNQTPLRTEIGVVRSNDRTLTPASELLLKHALEVADRCLA